MENKDMIKQNLERVRERITAACARSGRSVEDVTLIAVSKTKPVSMLEEAYACGVRDFGENKPQEIRDKYPCMPQDVRWHMIGNLQRNKIKYVIERACMIHSIDSPELALQVNEMAEKHNLVMPVLLEVNMAGELTKSGVDPQDAEAVIREMAKMKNLAVRGLMTIAPYVDDPEENRVHFRNLRHLCIDIASKNIDNVNMCDLSMGMTGDYEVAIEEGATLIRVGTGIFGERNYGSETNA